MDHVIEVPKCQAKKFGCYFKIVEIMEVFEMQVTSS